ncbi:hypothetical protein [Azotobacter armeniacus]
MTCRILLARTLRRTADSFVRQVLQPIQMGQNSRDDHQLGEQGEAGRDKK